MWRHHPDYSLPRFFHYVLKFSTGCHPRALNYDTGSKNEGFIAWISTDSSGPSECQRSKKGQKE